MQPQQATQDPPTQTAPEPPTPGPMPGPTPPADPTPPVSVPAAAGAPAKKSMNMKWLVVAGAVVVVALIVWLMTK